MSTPPEAGKSLSVRVDTQLYDDLSDLMRTGLSASDAVRIAVEALATVHRNGWAAGLPAGCRVVIESAIVRQLSDTHLTRLHVEEVSPCAGS